jgi:hypothetical protein
MRTSGDARSLKEKVSESAHIEASDDRLTVVGGVELEEVLERRSY